MSRGFGAMQREILAAYRVIEPITFFPHRGERPVCTVQRLWKAVASQLPRRQRAARVAFSRALRRLVADGWLTPADAYGNPLPLLRRMHIRFLQLDPEQWPAPPLPWLRTSPKEESQVNQPFGEKYSTSNQHLGEHHPLQETTDLVHGYNATTQTWQTYPRPDPATNNAYWQALIQESLRKAAQRQQPPPEGR